MGYYPLTLSACYSRATESERATAQKGIPMPGTGKRNRRKYKNGSGVSANSRVVSHHYADEGDTGPWLRRKIRRAEEQIWHGEIWEDLEDYNDGVI